jgi:hypothetical protein
MPINERFSVFVSKPDLNINALFCGYWRWRVMGDVTSAIFRKGVAKTFLEALEEGNKALKELPTGFVPYKYWLGEEYAMNKFREVE